jgi:hypothetical protein
MFPNVVTRDNSATSWLCYPSVPFGGQQTDAAGRITSDRTAMTTKRAGLAHRDPTDCPSREDPGRRSRVVVDRLDKISDE